MILKHQKELILDVLVDVITPQEIIEEIDVSLKNNLKYSIMAINPKKIMLAQENKTLKKALNNVTCAIPDGYYVVNQSKNIKERVTGIDLMQKICEEHEKLGIKIFLYGSSKKNLLLTKDVLESKYKNIKIVGYADGYEKKDIIRAINGSKANIVFVALGSPKQEIWIDNNKHKIYANIVMGVGGSFDVISGSVKRAPEFMQRFGFEWLYRFIKEPRRMREIPIYVKYLYLVKKGIKGKDSNER